MARKKKKRGSAAEGDAPAAAPKVPKNLSRPFAEALKGLTPAPRGGARAPSPPSETRGTPGTPRAGAPPQKPSASPERAPNPPKAPLSPAVNPKYSYEDRAAFNVAFANVAPIGAKPLANVDRAGVRAPDRVPRAPRVDFDAAARAKLASLVSEGLSFELRREEGWVEGRRTDAPKNALRDLRQGRAAAEAELDLHGMTGDEAVRALVHFLRRGRRDGRQIVRVIHGKGLHSAGGVGVLGDRVVSAIASGPAGPHVRAFVTAAMGSGGSGALLVRLETR